MFIVDVYSRRRALYRVLCRALYKALYRAFIKLRVGLNKALIEPNPKPNGYYPTQCNV